MKARELVADGLLSVTDACKWLGISRSMLYVLMERREIPYTRIGRKRLIPKRALAAYASANLVGRLAGQEIQEDEGVDSGDVA